jgi:medium-chain acyl-[acyl-carrier-protein] hydrolase
MTDPWFVKLNPTVEAPVRLLCFPSSGGGSNMYRQWGGKLDNVEIFSAQLPGRERRLREQPLDNIHVLVRELLPAAASLSNKPIILFGHSMGALVAYELACAMEKRNGNFPGTLLVSAFRTPERINRNKKLHPLEYQDFIDELKNYGGTPDEIINHRETMELLVPAIRADFKIHETYVFQGEHKLSMPIISFSGDRDAVVPGSHMIGWNNHTHREHSHHIIEGGHFFIHDNQTKFLAIIQEIVNQSVADELFSAV